MVASSQDQQVIIDLLVSRMQMADPPPAYVFLDEVQRLPRWELFLKKYYDLKTPIRFVVSGSASSPIFRSSQESLLGRVKDRHLLPFSFREFCEFRLRHRPEFACLLKAHGRLREFLLNGDGPGAQDCVVRLTKALAPYEGEINESVVSYCREGGFPEVWELSDPVRKTEYLMEQQVRKVLYEDLIMLTQYRKPENVLRFFVYLLSHPGVEVNITKIASSVGVERRVVEENLPRLEMTDLILRVPKFSHRPLRVRQGNLKVYPIDMALRNTVLKTWGQVESPLGVYAENLVVRELVSWSERIEVAYYREKGKEVDFVLTHGGNKYLPIEVKSGERLDKVDGLKSFMKRFDIGFGLVVTRRELKFENNILFLPLRYFLLAT